MTNNEIDAMIDTLIEHVQDFIQVSGIDATFAWIHPVTGDPVNPTGPEAIDTLIEWGVHLKGNLDNNYDRAMRGVGLG